MGADHPQLLFTLDQPPTYSDGRPYRVFGLTTVNSCLYVVYEEYNKVVVYNSEDGYKKVKDITVEGMGLLRDMVGSSETSQLFVRNWFSDVITQIDVLTGSCDVFA